MLIQYTNENQRKLADVLKNAVGSASTYVIPDLQRPYVWRPEQIILLVDSLFRRWPFGSILTWLVEDQTGHDNFGIPSRGLYRTVSRVSTIQSVEFGKSGPPTMHTMVLDGQQRLQSLILALASEDSSFIMDADDWGDSVDSLETQDHIAASLYLDFNLLKNDLDGKTVSKLIEANGIAPYLKWSDSLKPGRVLLAKLWNLVEGKEDRASEDWQNETAIFARYSITNDCINAFSQLLALIGRIRQGTIVPVLEIQNFREDESQRESYNDAIVNIFTRLNTAGRTLSKEEITLAWMKNGWTTGRENAGKQLDELLNIINEKANDLFDMDDLVRYLSFIWGVCCNEGKLIDSQDLLNGLKIKPIARYISESMQKIQDTTENALKVIEQTSVLDVLSSKNSLIVFMTWYYLVSCDSRINWTGLTIDRTNAEKNFDEFTRDFFNRWMFISMWSGEWNVNAVGFFSDSAKRLSSIRLKIQNDQDAEYLTLLKQLEKELIVDGVKDKALTKVQTIKVRKRNQVSQYRSMLWIWHRLDKERWDCSAKELKIPRRKLKLDVDHAVAYNKWVEDILPAQVAIDNADKDNELLPLCAPNGFASREDASAFINSIGNMSLLNKSFNSSKSKDDMKNFLLKIKEFRDDANLFNKWQQKLDFDASLTSPSSATFQDIVDSINRRETLIKSELAEFINGNLTRKDIE